MSKVLAVAWRDFQQTVMTKAFIFAVVGVPIMMVIAMIAVAAIISQHEEPPLTGRVVVIDDDGDVAAAASAAFDELRERRGGMMEAAREMAAADPAEAMQMGMDPTRAREMMARGSVDVTIERRDGDPLGVVPEGMTRELADATILAIALIPRGVTEPPAPEAPDGDADAAGADGAEGEPTTTEDGGSSGEAAPDERRASATEWRLLSGDHVDSDHVGLLERTIGNAIVDVRARRAGVDPDSMRALVRRPPAATDRVSETGDVRRESAAIRELKTVAVPIVFMMLIWVSTFSTGTHLLQSTIEEKSNRVMEVLLSAISPLQLLAGKILGQGLVGLIVVGVYASLGIAALLGFRQMNIISTEQLIAFGVFFFMAYFMVASMMAAVGSAVSDLRDANSLLTPVMLILMFPLMLWMPISQAPNGTIATVFSFVPPAIPFVMILRIAAEEGVPLWQFIVTTVWGYTCVLGMVWAASRIFRVGVLMTGKPPSPLELVRWVRHA